MLKYALSIKLSDVLITLTVAPSAPTPWPWLLKSPIQRRSTVLLEGTHPPTTVFGENVELLGNITWQQLT